MARKLELKSVPLGGPDEKQMLEYRKMLLDILRLPLDPRQGINYEQMAKRIKLLDKLEAAGVAKGLLSGQGFITSVSFTCSAA